MTNVQNEYELQNRKVKDNGAKLVFDDPILCAQFLRGYLDIDLLKDVRPEDIEDISERFLPMWQEEREADSVKKIRLKGQDVYLLALIEHQSQVHYDMAFRILRYIVMILNDYEAEQERLHPGITKTKDFKYPPILPIIYYEGTDTWTAVRNFKERVYLSDVFEKYIPDFEYMVVPLRSYTNEELIEKEDELSLIFLINKLRSSEEFKNLKEIPKEYLEHLEENTPEYLLKLISKIVASFLYRMNIPRGEVEEFTDQIMGREFHMLFDSFEAYDVQETRRISREEGLAAGREEGLAAGREEGLAAGREEGLAVGREEGLAVGHKEGLAIGHIEERIRIICQKLKKNKSVQEIADALEEQEGIVREMCEVVQKYAPDYDEEKIMEEINVQQEFRVL